MIRMMIQSIGIVYDRYDDTIRLAWYVADAKLYKWADTSNIKFNANKFELLRYGKEQEIKSATTYKSYGDRNIDDKEQ